MIPTISHNAVIIVLELNVQAYVYFEYDLLGAVSKTTIDMTNPTDGVESNRVLETGFSLSTVSENDSVRFDELKRVHFSLESDGYGLCDEDRAGYARRRLFDGHFLTVARHRAESRISVT